MGLERWRQFRLQSIADQINILNEDHRAAQEGLGIAHRNPGEVARDLIEYKWEKLSQSAVEIERLDKEHQDLMEMDLPRLIVEYKRKRK